MFEYEGFDLVVAGNGEADVVLLVCPIDAYEGREFGAMLVHGSSLD
jgi:hypothetical protein